MMESANCKELRYVEDMKIVKNKRKQILGSHKHFTDKEFPLEIGIEAAREKQIHWKRIVDLDDKARLFAEPNPLAGTMEVGLLNDHNFIAVLTAIWNHPKLLNYLFPPGQDFNCAEYCGFFYFRFWKMGKWVYVYVDDKLPILTNKIEDPAKKKLDRQKKTPGSGRSSQSSDTKNSSKSKLEGSSKKIDISDSSKKSDPEKRADEDEFPATPNENEPANNSVRGKEPKKVNGKQDELQNTSHANMTQDEPEREEIIQTADDNDAAAAQTSEPTSLTSAGHNKEKTDDRKQLEVPIPRVDDSENEKDKPLYVQVLGAQGENIYWAALFEKAYAKFCGGYHLMAKTSLAETLLDVTGGIVEIFYTNYLPPNFFLSLKQFTDNRSIVLATSTMPKKGDGDEEGKKNEEGTLFTVTQTVFTDFRKLLGINKMMGFVRLRKSNGALDWENNWTEASQEWELLPSAVKNKLGMTNEQGEFYLTYDNFLKLCSSVIVSTVPDGDNFNCEGYFGIWTRPRQKYSLCNLDELRFHEFPQHKIWVRDPNSDDNLFVEVVISLIQSGNCCCSNSNTLVGIMFFLFCLELGRTYTPPLGFNFFRFNRPVGCSNFSSEKEVSGRFYLPPGHYLVVSVPDYTDLVHPCLTGDYLLRVVTPSKFPRPPPPHMAVTFCESENLNIYFDYAETIEEPKVTVALDSKDTSQSETSRNNHKDKGSRTKKKKTKH